MKSFEAFVPQQLSSPLVVSNPHSGLKIHHLRPELNSLSKDLLLRDADYEIHQIWQPVCSELQVPWIGASFHRYNLDLNRSKALNSDFVEGHTTTGKGETKGLFWTQSTKGESLNFSKLTISTANALINELWEPYYHWIQCQLERAHQQFGYAFLLDGHSMPSRGELNHSDRGALRADIVPGNLDSTSCPSQLNSLVEELCLKHSFSCRFNEPYKGGNITQHFSKNTQNKYFALQIEVNRATYMNEETKELKTQGIEKLRKFTKALMTGISELKF